MLLRLNIIVAEKGMCAFVSIPVICSKERKKNVELVMILALNG